MNYESTVSFDRAVNVPRTLDQADVKFRHVRAGELIALFDGEIVRLKPTDGGLSAAREVSVRFFQTTASTPGDWPLLAQRLRSELVDQPVPASNAPIAH